MTEPPALMSVPEEGVSGLWLWQGAPPDQQNAPPNQKKGQRVPRRGALWLSIGAPLIVAALSTLAAFVLIVPRLPVECWRSQLRAIKPPSRRRREPPHPPLGVCRRKDHVRSQ
jgi:hypothetical protein